MTVSAKSIKQSRTAFMNVKNCSIIVLNILQIKPAFKLIHSNLFECDNSVRSLNINFNATITKLSQAKFKLNVISTFVLRSISVQYFYSKINLNAIPLFGDKFDA